MNRIIVTGGAGFIGSAVVRHIIQNTQDEVCVIDKLTYAGNLESLESVSSNARYRFEKLDICDKEGVSKVFESFKPTCVMHLAAESHVDRSIDGPGEFIQTNIVGTYTLLECARNYFSKLNDQEKTTFRFHHISTDEVYGDLAGPEDLFTESTPYAPSSPYSASKASSDHLVRAWKRTFNLPTIVTNCSNNYGPYHFPEKLIPLVILHALDNQDLPVYGQGLQIRDWLYVEDHCKAIDLIIHNGKVGEVYNIGGHNEMKNIDIVKLICKELDKPECLITYVADRKGHDMRYAIDPTKIHSELGWLPETKFADGIKLTIKWYLDNRDWWEDIINGEYQNYYEKMYGNRGI